MAQRVAFGTLAISVVIGLAGGDALLTRTPPFAPNLLSRGSLIPCVVAVLAVVACRELVGLVRRANYGPYAGWAVGCCLALVFAPWLSAAGIFGVGPSALEGLHLQMALTAGAFLGTGVLAVLRRDVAGGLANVAATWLIIGYAGILPSFLTMLRSDTYLPGEYGAWVILTVIAVCKASDIGAYFIGSLFGRHKLIPLVSPAKSVEGVIGGVAASCSVSLVFYSIRAWTQAVDDPLSSFTIQDRSVQLAQDITVVFSGLDFTQAIIFAVVTSLVGQFGDLFESLLKRSAAMKDSGSIVPGFGGILDMIDSPLAAAPAAWILLTQVWSV